jgi:hypothetical protein
VAAVERDGQGLARPQRLPKDERNQMANSKVIVIPRDILLFEIDRRCSFPDCGNRVLIGLTKHEAINYTGFECEHCHRWNDNQLTQKDVPEWWDEIQMMNQAPS